MKTKLLFSMILVGWLTACDNSGFKNATGNQTQGGGTVDNSATWQSVKTETDSAADGGTYAGLAMISVDQARETLNLSLPLPPLAILPLSLVAFQELPGTTIQSQTLPDGTETWVLAIPLKYVLRGAQLRAFNTLPNGDPLPYLPTGEVNGLSIALPQKPDYRISLYIAVGAAAVFIETPNWEIPSYLSLWTIVKNRAKTRQIGYFQIVPNKNNFSSGIYLAAKLPADIARVLGTVVRF
jgi:hypothetical protein